jgi:hypothetical protein
MPELKQTFMLVAFDVTGLTGRERDQLSGYVSAQAEGCEDYRGVPEPFIAFTGAPAEPDVDLTPEQAEALAKALAEIVTSEGPTMQFNGLEVRMKDAATWEIHVGVFDLEDVVDRTFITEVDRSGATSSYESN